MLDNFLEMINGPLYVTPVTMRGQVEVNVLANHLGSRRTTILVGIIAIVNHWQGLEMIILN